MMTFRDRSGSTSGEDFPTARGADPRETTVRGYPEAAVQGY
jgi:hypothetical protein